MHSLNIYLDLQARIILRAFRNAGLVVSLVVMLVLAMVMLGLFYAPNQFVVLGGCFIVLMVRHQCRKDTPFLMTLFDERTMKLILMTEYIIITLPFILISLAKTELWQVLLMIVMAITLPTIKPLTTGRNRPLPLPFLYRGGIDMLCTIRLTWWVYPLLMLGAVEGCINDNVNLIKVCIIGQTLTIAMFGNDYRPLMMHYRSFWLYVKENTKMVLQDATLLLLPFLCILFYKEQDILWTINMFLAGLLTIISFLLLRLVTSNPLIFFVNIIILATAYVTTIMLGWGYLAFIAMILIYFFRIYDKYCFLWR